MQINLRRSELMRYTPLLLIVYTVALIIFLNSWGPTESSEARYAEIAREMLNTGDWLHPKLLNIYHFHKPPFTYWLTAFGYLIFGVNSIGVRFFLVVSFLVQLLLVYKIVLLLFRDKNLAFASAWIYSTMPLVLISIRCLTTDAYLNTFVLLTIFTFLQWRTSQRPYWLYLLAIAAGLGFLTKGPLILIIPILFFIGFNKKLPPSSFSYHHILSLLLFLMSGFWWYVYLAMENREFIDYFLFHQTYERVVKAEVFKRSEPVWYYVLYTPLLALPWTILLFTGFAKFSWRNIPPLFKRVVIFFILLPLVFFSLVSSKLILYVLPVFPGISIMAAFFLLHIKENSRKEMYVLFYFIIVALSLAVIKLFDKTVVLSAELLILPVMAVIIFLGFRFYKKISNVDRILLGAFIFSIFLLSYSARFMKYNELKVNSTKPIAEWIKEKGLQDRNIMVYNRLLPSLAFNLNEDIISLDDGNSYLQREVEFEENDHWKEHLYDLSTPEDVARLKSVLERSPVLVVKGKVDSTSVWIEKYFAHRYEEGKWSIYY